MYRLPVDEQGQGEQCQHNAAQLTYGGRHAEQECDHNMVSQRPPKRKVQDTQKLSPKQKMLNGVLLSNARPMCRSQTTGKNRRRTKSLGEKAREPPRLWMDKRGTLC